MTRWDVVSEAGDRFLERAAESGLARAVRQAQRGRGRRRRRVAACRPCVRSLRVRSQADPGGFDENFNIVPSGAFIHVLPPAIGFEMATITDFRGVIAAAEIQGTAQGTDGTPYTFDTDMRFMQGTYVGMDGGSTRGRSASSESTSTRAPWATRRRRSTTSSRASSRPGSSGRSLSLAPRASSIPGRARRASVCRTWPCPTSATSSTPLAVPSLPGHVSLRRPLGWRRRGDGGPRSGVRIRRHLRRQRGDDLVQGVRRQSPRRHLHVESRPVERECGRRLGAERRLFV